MLNHKQQSVNAHSFSMVPRSDVPRATFRRQQTHKTTFDANYLIPIFVDEVLPGDTFALKHTAFARLATPIAPLMDNLYLDTFFFFVPCRLVWIHWREFMGQNTTNMGIPSTSYTIPVINLVGVGGGWGLGTVGDYMGLPTVNDLVSSSGMTFSHSALPLRAYNLIWDEWFRDQNLELPPRYGSAGTIGNVAGAMDDGPDINANFPLLKRCKAHDYFTGCLPWAQKGNPVGLPLTGQAPIFTGAPGSAMAQIGGPVTPFGLSWSDASGASTAFTPGMPIVAARPGGTYNTMVEGGTTVAGGSVVWQPDNLFADLALSTAVTINSLRLAFQTQKLLERDARGGTRYTEIIRAHFGVVSPDARLQRPEYLGGGTTPINYGAIPQSSATGLTGGSTPQGNLAAYASLVSHGHGFVQSFTEHGYIIGLANVRADITYQRGVRKMWTRQTRYDFYFPAFAMLGEQAVLNQEIYAQGLVGTTTGLDQAVFGYQERWAEYRYLPSLITGLFRSTAPAPLDFWHVSEKFTSLPTLSNTFIAQNTPMARVTAVNANLSTFICDNFFDVKTTRPMPLFSVPGMIDHF